jgi:hypothetical protein
MKTRAIFRLALVFLGYLAVLSLLLMVFRPPSGMPEWLAAILVVGGLWLFPTLLYFFVLRSLKTGHESVFLLFWSAVLGIISSFGFFAWMILLRFGV